MKVLRTRGPFSERPYYEAKEIERIANEELRSVGLFPSSPKPVRVDRFIEKRFGVTPSYDELPKGVLGYTRFGSNGVEEIIVSRSLSEEGDAVTERRINTTLAHETGHGLLHAHLFVLKTFNQSLFDDEDASPGKVLCREQSESGGASQTYDGRWWEFQANQLMGSLLLPRTLVFKCLEPWLVEQGSLGTKALPRSDRERAARSLADVFDVNPVVARIRIQQLCLTETERQLTL